MIDVRSLTASEGQQHIEALANVLVDCVEGGASVSFMAPFTTAEAQSFFRKILEDVAAGNRILFAAFLDANLVGTVQLITKLPPNQPHRAEVAKLLVHRSARGHGIATQLMSQLEQSARAMGKTLLMLDTVTGSTAERLYTNLGWTKAGVIPNFALMPDGEPCATTIFWKTLK